MIGPHPPRLEVTAHPSGAERLAEGRYLDSSLVSSQRNTRSHSAAEPGAVLSRKRRAALRRVRQGGVFTPLAPYVPDLRRLIYTVRVCLGSIFLGFYTTRFYHRRHLDYFDDSTQRASPSRAGARATELRLSRLASSYFRWVANLIFCGTFYRKYRSAPRP